MRCDLARVGFLGMLAFGSSELCKQLLPSKNSQDVTPSSWKTIDRWLAHDGNRRNLAVTNEMQRPANIETERLVLLVLLPDELEALIARDLDRAAESLGAILPPETPDIGDLQWHLNALLKDAGHLPWRMRVIIERSSRMLVGSINLKGPPNANGDVEIGWGLSESARGKGYATEAAEAVIQWAIQQPGVRSISATVPNDNPASQRVSARLGLSRTNETRRETPLWKAEAIHLRKSERL